MTAPALIALALLPLVWSCAPEAEAARPEPGTPQPGSLTLLPEREFARRSYVHQPLADNAERDPRSAIWVADIQRQIRAYYGTASINIDRFSPPVYLVAADQPTVPVRAVRVYDPHWSFPSLERLWADVPVPDGFKPSAGTDSEAIIYQPSTGRYWEFWLLGKTGSRVKDSSGRMVEEWRAAWGGHIEKLGENPGYFPTGPDGITYGTAATGLVLLAGLMTIDELRRGEVAHAIHFSLPETRESSVWVHPAQRSDGLTHNEDAIPEGATFRLPPDLDLDRLEMDPLARIIAKAVQRFGMVLRDRAGAVTFYAENPAGRFEKDPYFGPEGIMRCPSGRFEWSCAPDGHNRLAGFPWHRLVALKAEFRGKEEAPRRPSPN